MAAQMFWLWPISGKKAAGKVTTMGPLNYASRNQSQSAYLWSALNDPRTYCNAVNTSESKTLVLENCSECDVTYKLFYIANKEPPARHSSKGDQIYPEYLFLQQRVQWPNGCMYT